MQQPNADGNGKTEVAGETDQARVFNLLKEFSTLMMMTFDKKGKHPRINARPMHVAKLEKDCRVLFVTDVGSEKVEEAAKYDGHLTGQSWNRQISLHGTYEVTQDRAKLAEVWSLPMNVYFPGGKDDPRACLITFTPRDAELWDSSGLKGLEFLVDSAKALITRKPPEASEDQHANVKLHRD